MKLNITGSLSVESEFNDNIFNDNIGGLNSLVTNKEYKEPMVKTWIYTNINNAEIWVKDNDIPIPATYSNRLFSSEQLGLYIVKRYCIRNENSFKLNTLLRYIAASIDDTININKNELTKLITDNLTNNDNYGENFVLRFKYFIPKHEIMSHRVIKSNNYIISTQLNNISDYENIGKVTNNVSKLKFELTYSNSNNNNLTFDVMGSELTLNANNPYSNGNVRVLIKNEDDVIIKENNYEEEEFRSIGLINNINDTKYSDKLSELGMANIKLKSAWLQYMVEHDISLNKLLAYIVNAETAKVKLDKEESALYRESLKFIKDMIP